MKSQVREVSTAKKAEDLTNWRDVVSSIGDYFQILFTLGH